MVGGQKRPKSNKLISIKLRNLLNISLIQSAVFAASLSKFAAMIKQHVIKDQLKIWSVKFLLFWASSKFLGEIYENFLIGQI